MRPVREANDVMKGRTAAVLFTAVLVLGATAPALAQTGASPHEHAQQPPAAPPAAGGPGSSSSGAGHGMMPMAMCQEMMRGGMTARGMMGGGMPMMGGGMSGGMMDMPMMGGAGMSPKAMGEMLEMRAEIMKAVADVMLKHARRMQQPATK